jgi:hypothetical protein
VDEEGMSSGLIEHLEGIHPGRTRKNYGRTHDQKQPVQELNADERRRAAYA